jgi:hypothetical protein
MISHRLSGPPVNSRLNISLHQYKSYCSHLSDLCHSVQMQFAVGTDSHNARFCTLEFLLHRGIVVNCCVRRSFGDRMSSLLLKSASRGCALFFCAEPQPRLGGRDRVVSAFSRKPFSGSFISTVSVSRPWASIALRINCCARGKSATLAVLCEANREPGSSLCTNNSSFTPDYPDSFDPSRCLPTTTPSRGHC